MKYYIIAGEASGDLHGANLMRSIKKRDPQAKIRFWGGDAMIAEGGQLVKHIRDLAYMGFVEVAMHMDAVLGNIAYCKQDLLQYRPDAVIYIDYPGFNLKIAKFAHQHGFRNFHYISPQLWAWKKGRIKSMRENLDLLCYILPFEQEFYSQNNFPQAIFVGHPLLDAVDSFKAKGERLEVGIPADKKVVALLPGSRKQELNHMLPAMARLAQRHPEYEFVIAGMSLLGSSFYGRYVDSVANLSVVYNQTYQLLGRSDAAVVCSGTATLETALFDVPQVVCYKANALSIAIARRIVSKRVKCISLVNLIADESIVRELIQEDFNDQVLDAEFEKITMDEQARAEMRKGYARVKKLLGNSGASDRVADAIINKLNQLSK